jgi:peptide/nickel transport system substrate-binding protein
LEEVKPDDYVSLVRNDDHWLKPNLDKIILKPIPDPNALLMALEAGDVDLVAQIPQKDVERIGATPGLVVMKQGTAAYRFIAFNCEKDPTSSLEFRDAICAAIDMDGAVNAIFPPGMAERAVGPVAPPNLGYDPSLSKYWEYNPEKALETLGKLGWKDTDSDGVLDKEGKPLKLRIIAPQDANRSKLSVIVATSLNEIGIKAEVQNLEWGTLLSESDKGNFDMLILGGYSGPNGMIFMFHSRNKGPNGNSARYENPRVDELLELGVTLLDPEEREPVWKEAQELVVKDRAHMPAYHEYFFFAYNDEVKDYAGNFQFVSEINNVWLGR